VTYTITGNTIQFDWDAPDYATGYIVNFDDTDYETNLTTETFTGLITGYEYVFVVTAFNIDGVEGPQSYPPISVTIPNPVPGQVTVVSGTALSISEIQFVWDAPDEYAASYNLVFEGLETPTNLLTETFGGLSPGTTYSFQIRAANVDGVEGLTNIIYVITIPDEVTWTDDCYATGIDKIDLSWYAVDGATTYTITPPNGSGFPGSLTIDAGNTSYTFTDLSLAYYTTYTFSIHASNSSGDGAETSIDIVSSVPVPGKVTGVSTGTITSSEIELYWDAPEYAYSYDVLLDDSPYDIAYSNTITLTDLTPGTTYSINVQAANSDGNTGDISDPITVATLEE
jgi:hypothetical protein